MQFSCILLRKCLHMSGKSSNFAAFLKRLQDYER